MKVPVELPAMVWETQKVCLLSFHYNFIAELGSFPQKPRTARNG